MNLSVIGADEDIENTLKDLGEAFLKVEEEAEKILKELEEVFSSVDIEKEKLPKPCKSIGEPHTKTLQKLFKDHRNSRKYWRR